MTTPAFQDAALSELRDELGRGDIPLGQIQEFARRVLRICAEHPADLPEAALKPLIEDFPELSRAFVAAVKRAEADTTERAIEELRSKLSDE